MSTTPQAPVLPRVLGPVTAVAIVVGTIIGSGVFKKPAAIAKDVPEFGLVALVWIGGGLLVLMGALVYAEVAVVLPRSGGNYVFLREGFGRLAGFLWGWVDFWIIRSASLSALSTIFSESLADIIQNEAFQYLVGLEPGTRLGLWWQRLITIALLVSLAVVNMRGTRWGGGLQLVVTVVKVGSLLTIALLPWYLFGRGEPISETTQLPDTANLAPVWPSDWSKVSVLALTGALLSVLWPYHGWMNIAPIAGEVREPQRNLPLSLLVGVGIVIVLYLSVNLAYYLALNGTEIAALNKTTTANAFALRLMGDLGAVAISFAVMLSVFGALNGNVLVGPRLLFAMGEDGLAPRWLYTVHARYQTPMAAIAVLTGWSIIQVLVVGVLHEVGAVSDDDTAFDLFTNFAMFGAIIFETLAVVTIFVLRRTMPDAPRPYRCPGYPILPALYVVVPFAVLVGTLITKPGQAATGLGFIAAGVAAYMVLGLGKRYNPNTPTPPLERFR